MDTMEKIKVFPHQVAADEYVARLYAIGYEAYQVVRDSGEVEVRYNEYQ